MRRMVLTTAFVYIATAAAADGFREDLTIENFGDRFDLVAGVALPGIPILVEKKQCQSVDAGDLLNACNYVIAGRPITVQAKDAGSGQADWIRILAYADEPSDVAVLVDLTALTALMLDPDAVDAVHQATTRAIVTAREGRAVGDGFAWRISTSESGAIASIFEAR